jgi:hypothetical protein
MPQTPPWQEGLGERIDAALPEIIGIVQPRARDADECRSSATLYLERIARDWSFAVRPSVERKAYVDAAAKIREGLAMIPPGSIFSALRHREADDVEQFAKYLEEEARGIPNRRGGGSHRDWIGKKQKIESAEAAYFLLGEYGTRSRPTTTANKSWVQLATVMFEAATGRRGNLTKAVKSLNQTLRSSTTTAGRSR